MGLFNLFTPLESPGIYAGDVINRRHRLLVKAGSMPHLSNGVYPNDEEGEGIDPGKEIASPQFYKE
jgi:hypothetical protein